MVGGSQQLFVPILPKPVSTVTTGDVTSAVAMPTGQTKSSQSGSISKQSQLSSSTVTSSAITSSPITPLDNVSVNFTTPGPLLSVVSSTTPVLPSSQNNLPTSSISQTKSNQPVNIDQLTQRPISTSTTVPQVGLPSTLQNRSSILVQGPLQTLPAVSSVALTPFLQNPVNISSQSLFSSPAVISMTGSSQPAYDSQRQLPLSTAFIAGNTAIPIIGNHGNFVNPHHLESFGFGSMMLQGQSSRSTEVPGQLNLQSISGSHSFNQTVAGQDLDSQLRALGEAMVLASQDPILMSNSTVSSSLTSSTPPLRSVQSHDLNTLADAAVWLEPSTQSPSSNGISSNVQVEHFSLFM